MNSHGRVMIWIFSFLSAHVFLSLLCYSLLTSRDCSELRSDRDQLFKRAEDTLLQVDAYLRKADKVKNTYEGVVGTVVDEDDGITSGGGTNTFGSYNSVLFNGTLIYPGDMCETVPSVSGESRCDWTDSFLLGASDVMVMYMCTPPPVRYFSHDVIIGTRLTEEYPFYPGQPFGNAISHLTINVDNNESVYDEPFVLIHAADKGAAELVEQAFLSAGVYRSQINVRYLSSTVRFWDRSNGQADNWKETAPDILSHIGRVSVPDEGYEDFYALYKQIFWPTRLYLSDNDQEAIHPVEPPITSRYSIDIVDEISLLNDTLSLLYDAVLKSWTSSESRKVNFLGKQTVNLTELGYYDDWDQIFALKNNDSFVAGTRDATYGIPIGYFGPFNTTTCGTLIGVNHNFVNELSYNSVGLDLFSLGQYYETHWFLDVDLYGSAVRYLGEDNALSEFLYAIDFYPPGGCEGQSSSTKQWCVEFDSDSYDLFKLRKIYPMLGERIYTVQKTALGSPANITLPAMWLQFGS